jgi:gas vesicle protein
MTKEEQNNSGFLFGLSLGAALGALSAILISKNGETEVVQNFESKIKDFFQDLINTTESPKKESSKKIEYIAVKEDHEPIFVVKKKPTPKMFVKPKK